MARRRSDTLKGSHEEQSTAEHLRLQVKNTAMALEYLGQPSTEPPDANIDSLDIALVAQETSPRAAGRAHVSTGAQVQNQRGENVESGDGQELPSLRLVEMWNRPEDGEMTFPLAPTNQFSFVPGGYQVEIYLEGQLIQETAFTLGDDQELIIEPTTGKDQPYFIRTESN